MAAFDTLIAGLPPSLQLDNGCTVVIEAVSATTGLAITGVTVSAWSIWAEGVEGTQTGGFSSGPFMFVPGPNA